MVSQRTLKQTKQKFYFEQKKKKNLPPTSSSTISFFPFKSMHVLLIVLAARVGPQGQLDSIKLRFPERAIPGSVGAVVYLTGESAVILFDVSLN